MNTLGLVAKKSKHFFDPKARQLTHDFGILKYSPIVESLTEKVTNILVNKSDYVG